MPQPFSNTYFNQEVDYQALPREVVLDRLTPKALLEKTASTLLSNWNQFVPKDSTNQPAIHRGPGTALLDMATTGQLKVSDETGTISVGPYGFQITNSSDADEKLKPWSLDVGSDAASFSKGDFGIGGTYGTNKSGFIRKGPIRIDAGYGRVTPYLPSDTVAPQNTYQIKQGAPEKWIKVGVELGTPKEMRGLDVFPEFQAETAVDRAVKPFISSEPFAPAIKTAREEAEDFLTRYKEKNEDWWRP